VLQDCCECSRRISSVSFRERERGGGGRERDLSDIEEVVELQGDGSHGEDLGEVSFKFLLALCQTIFREIKKPTLLWEI
jgi:hypothetical protein